MDCDTFENGYIDRLAAMDKIKSIDELVEYQLETIYNTLMHMIIVDLEGYIVTLTLEYSVLKRLIDRIGADLHVERTTREYFGKINKINKKNRFPECTPTMRIYCIKGPRPVFVTDFENMLLDLDDMGYEIPNRDEHAVLDLFPQDPS